MAASDHPVTLHTIPCLEDNYAYVLHNTATGMAALVDVPDAAPILDLLGELDATLAEIFLTHHHWDHVDGLPALMDALDPATTVKVLGAKADVHRLPALTQAVAEGDTVHLAGLPAEILDVSGHTVGHLAAYMPDLDVAFTADSLMALGCGRLFEGTPPQMWASLQKLRALPPETLICSGHEYAQTNARFALTIEPDNTALIARMEDIDAKRQAGQATVPTKLSLECATNPFLRADVPALQTAINMVGTDPAEIFTEIRRRRDQF